jgi:hypothetical protein
MIRRAVKWLLRRLGIIRAKPAQELIEPMAGKRLALCIGINEYPDRNSRLRFCVNDVKWWGNLLKNKFGFAVYKLLDGQATRGKIRRAIRGLVHKAKIGDTVVIQYSGHGTKVRDRNGDEPDKYDEALYVWGRTERSSILTDDEIRKDLSGLTVGAQLIFISDSCHSGTITRALNNGVNVDPTYCRPRYRPVADSPSAGRVRRRLMHPEKDMTHLLLTGCKASEYSYETQFGNEGNGAMTRQAVKILRAEQDLTWLRFHRKLRKVLPNAQLPQTPQLEGPPAMKKRKVFA